MKKITAYKVGTKIFESETEANDYENNVKLTLAISNFVENHFTYNMSKDDIKETICENLTELKEILK